MIPRLARWCFRHRVWTVVLWLIFVVAAVGIGSSVKGDWRADYAAPGSDSKAAQDILKAHLNDRSGDTFDIVYEVPSGVNNPEFQAALKQFQKDIMQLKDPAQEEGDKPNKVVGVAGVQVSQDGKVGITTVLTDYDSNLPQMGFAKALVDLKKQFNEKIGDLGEVELSGQIPGVAEQTQSPAEAIGFVAAIIILFIAFGSAIAMGLPIGTALLSLFTATGLIGIIAKYVTVPDWASIIASMILIGVGIDYALFIVTRFRQGLKEGMQPEDAAVKAMNTAGRAVVFAGCTVVIALLGLSVMKQGYLYGVALSASTGVLVVMVSSVTLIPALLGFTKYKVNGVLVQNPGISERKKSVGKFFYNWTPVGWLYMLAAKLSGGKRGRIHPYSENRRFNKPDDPNSFWHRWSHAIQAKPWLYVFGCIAVLALLTLPVKDMHLGFPDAGNTPKDTTVHKAFDIQTKAFGAGSGANVYIVAAVNSPADAAKLPALQKALTADKGLVFVSPPQVSKDGKAALIVAQPTTSPQDEATEQLVKRLRNDVIPAATNGDLDVHVGGLTAGLVDSSRYIADRLLLFIGSVVFLSFLLLMVVFRSIFVPLKAAVMNLLSIGAAYGVMAYACNGTWLGKLIGIPDPTPIPSFVPMIMFAILFGLSMDYELFLLSRIREEYSKTGDNANAVADGLAATARVITAAAAIMICVFGAFIFDPNTFVKAIGLGLATAILVDASIIRLLLVPATMELLGDWNWWYPKWLDKITPRVHIEEVETVDITVAPTDRRDDDLVDA